MGDAGAESSSAPPSGDSAEASPEGWGEEGDTTGITVRDEPQPPAAQETPGTESFIDPATLPPELKQHWTRMHRAYTQGLERIKGVSDKAAIVDRFYNDPQFAAATVAQWAQQHGVQLGGPPAQSAPPSPPPAAGAPPEIVEAMRQQLRATTPELEWMAPSLAPAVWTAIQQAVGPVVHYQQAQTQQWKQEQQQYEVQQQAQAYAQVSATLSEPHPGWEEHEKDMTDVLTFLTGPALQHPMYGSKLEILFNLVTGGAASTRKAVQRMQDATKRRASSSTGGSATGTNVAERVLKADTRRGAFQIAGEAALRQLEQQGVL